MKCFYRLSDNSYNKERFPGVTKELCLRNFTSVWPSGEIVIVADRLSRSSSDWLSRIGKERPFAAIVPIDAGTHAFSLKKTFELALQDPNLDCAYFVEDDYWHLPGSRTALQEGLGRSDYVTLYDHADKYLTNGPNPFVTAQGGEETIVIKTASRHWKRTNSTTCTFAVKLEILRADYHVWQRWCFPDEAQKYSRAFEAFVELREKGRTLISALPGLSTHCEPRWASPFVDWKNQIERFIGPECSHGGATTHKVSPAAAEGILHG